MDASARPRIDGYSLLKLAKLLEMQFMAEFFQLKGQVLNQR